MNLFKIEVRKIHENKHGRGGCYTQYLLTLPKDFAKKLKAKGVTNLYLVYNEALMAFPADKVTEQEIIAFLENLPEIEKLLTYRGES